MTDVIDMSTGEVVVHQPTGLAKYEGEQGLENARQIAKQLDHFIRERKLCVRIGQGEHLKVEAWCALGTMVGVSPVTEWCKPIEVGTASGFHARVEVVRIGTDEVVGGAEALCMDNEMMRGKSRWTDYHAMMSMAQTRATSKALGQVLRWIPELAGYSGTPAEEMLPSAAETVPDRLGRARAHRTEVTPAELDTSGQNEAVATAIEVLGPQTVETQARPFGEEEMDTAPGGVADPISPSQANRALTRASVRAKEIGLQSPRQVIDDTLVAFGHPKSDPAATWDDMEIHLAKYLTWDKNVYDKFIKAVDTFSIADDDCPF